MVTPSTSRTSTAAVVPSAETDTRSGPSSLAAARSGLSMLPMLQPCHLRGKGTWTHPTVIFCGIPRYLSARSLDEPASIPLHAPLGSRAAARRLREEVDTFHVPKCV